VGITPLVTTGPALLLAPTTGPRGAPGQLSCGWPQGRRREGTAMRAKDGLGIPHGELPMDDLAWECCSRGHLVTGEYA